MLFNADSPAPVAHILNFFYDSEYNSALTAEVDGIRFHAIADADALQCRLTGSRSNPAGREYLQLIQKAKQTDEDGSDAGKPASSDSGVDMGSGDRSSSKDIDAADAAEDALHAWIVKAVVPALHNIERPQSDYKMTLEEWYLRKTYFFQLQVTDSELSTVELDPDQELEDRISALIPEISVPKYIRNIGAPWLHARDLIVLDGSASPWPYHPTRVQHGDKIYFLKHVDSSQPQPTKREIAILRKLEENNVHTQIRVPKLEGLVTFDDHTKLLGFLQTDIASSAPLTTKLDVEVSQQLRDKWADEADHVKEVLHENGIVWGDAKADNFMVDEHDQLWIIDFGGSYTEGWVDPEIQETEEGDDMGVEKIVNALHDPIGNTWYPDSHGLDGIESDVEAGDKDAEEEDEGPSRPCKRKYDAEKEDDDEREVSGGNKRQRKQVNKPEEAASYCYCGESSSGDMIACDNGTCEKQWFHFECAGISKTPEEDEEWYCKDCRDG